MKHILLIGATGLLGNAALLRMLDNPEISGITVIVRKSTGIVHKGLHEIITNLDSIPDELQKLKCDVFVCTLGTTIKKAGNKQAFRHIDFEIPLRYAKLVVAQGCQKMILVSAIGASLDSSIFYNRVKGELETELKKLPFKELVIIQPSMLMGPRKEVRIGESIGKLFMYIFDPFLKGALSKWHSIHSEDIGKFISEKSSAPIIEGTTIYHYSQIVSK